MTENTPTSLCDVINPYASEGANDQKWILIEHQLAQVKMSVQIALQSVREVTLLPENDKEKAIAMDCQDIIQAMHLDILEHYTTFLCYLSGTPVSENMGRKEL